MFFLADLTFEPVVTVVGVTAPDDNGPASVLWVAPGHLGTESLLTMAVFRTSPHVGHTAIPVRLVRCLKQQSAVVNNEDSFSIKHVSFNTKTIGRVYILSRLYQPLFLSRI